LYELERDLVEDLKAGLATALQPSLSSFLTTELTLRTRVVDVAFAEAEDPRVAVTDWPDYAAGFRRLGAPHAALLAIIWQEKRISVDRLARCTWSDARAIRHNYIDGMAKARLIEVSSRGTVTPTSWANWSPGALIAVEAKLTDWRRAVVQATDHLEWADYSYIAMPSGGYLSRRDVRLSMREHGIGGLAVHPEDGVSLDVRARRSRKATGGRARVAINLLTNLSASDTRGSWRMSEAV